MRSSSLTSSEGVQLCELYDDSLRCPETQLTLELQFARFIKAFKVPYDKDGLDPQDAVGCEGDFTIVNEEYQGRVSPKIADWLQ